MENTTVNKVIASGRCVAITPYRKNLGKRVTLLCRDHWGNAIFPQFYMNRFDNSLLQKNVRIEGLLWNMPRQVENKTLYKTSLRGLSYEECPDIFADMDHISDRECDNRIRVYLQGKITTLRPQDAWTTFTIDVGKERHNPIRVSMKTKVKELQMGDHVKCVGTLLTPRKERNGKKETFNNVIILDAQVVKEE